MGCQMQICSILHFSWSILVKCCVHLTMSSNKSQMLLEKTGIHNYSFFLRVVSWASTPDGILAGLQFGLPRQKCRII